MRSLPLFWLGRVIPFALINLIPLPCFVDGGPVNGDFWDLETISSFPDFDVAPPADLWFNDASTDVDFLSWPDFPDSSPEFDDGTDPFLASNPSCHADADADLTQFEPYSKLRARQACPAPNQPDPPPLAVPSLDSLGSPDDGSANAGTLNELFRIVPDLPTTAHDSEQEQKTCPADRTFNSKVPVCDSGKMLDTHTVPGLAYSTLYNVQPYTFTACPYPSTLWCCLTVAREHNEDYVTGLRQYSDEILVGYICYSTLSWDFVI